MSAIEWSKKAAMIKEELEIAQSYQKLGVDNVRQVRYVLEDIMQRSKMPDASKLTTEEASQMIVKACQATKKDVIKRCIAQMKKEMDILKKKCLEEEKKFKQEISVMSDLNKLHKFAMILH